MTCNWRNIEPWCWEPEGDDEIEEDEEVEEPTQGFDWNDEPPERYFDDIDAARMNDIMVDNTMRFVCGGY